MSRYDDHPAASVRAFLDSRKRPEPTAAELAASILDDYGFTADDILDGLAADGTITILPLLCISEERAMDEAGFTEDERTAFMAAADVPARQCTPEQADLLVRYEKARNGLMYGKEDW